MKAYCIENRLRKIALWEKGALDGMRGKTSTAHWLREHFLDLCSNKCQRCGWGEVNIFTKKIPLELEHIDGDFTNNKKENLIILCPNCHALTSTYKGANKKQGRPRAKYYRGT